MLYTRKIMNTDKNVGRLEVRRTINKSLSDLIALQQCLSLRQRQLTERYHRLRHGHHLSLFRYHHFVVGLVLSLLENFFEYRQLIIDRVRAKREMDIVMRKVRAVVHP